MGAFSKTVTKYKSQFMCYYFDEVAVNSNGWKLKKRNYGKTKRKKCLNNIEMTKSLVTNKVNGLTPKENIYKLICDFSYYHERPFVTKKCTNLNRYTYSGNILKLETEYLSKEITDISSLEYYGEYGSSAYYDYMLSILNPKLNLIDYSYEEDEYVWKLTEDKKYYILDEDKYKPNLHEKPLPLIKLRLPPNSSFRSDDSHDIRAYLLRRVESEIVSDLASLNQYKDFDELIITWENIDEVEELPDDKVKFSANLEITWKDYVATEEMLIKDYEELDEDYKKDVPRDLFIKEHLGKPAEEPYSITLVVEKDLFELLNNTFNKDGMYVRYIDKDNKVKFHYIKDIHKIEKVGDKRELLSVDYPLYGHRDYTWWDNKRWKYWRMALEKAQYKKKWKRRYTKKERERKFLDQMIAETKHCINADIGQYLNIGYCYMLECRREFGWIKFFEAVAKYFDKLNPFAETWDKEKHLYLNCSVFPYMDGIRHGMAYRISGVKKTGKGKFKKKCFIGSEVGSYMQYLYINVPDYSLSTNEERDKGIYYQYTQYGINLNTWYAEHNLPEPKVRKRKSSIGMQLARRDKPISRRQHLINSLSEDKTLYKNIFKYPDGTEFKYIGNIPGINRGVALSDLIDYERFIIEHGVSRSEYFKTEEPSTMKMVYRMFESEEEKRKRLENNKKKAREELDKLLAKKSELEEKYGKAKEIYKVKVRMPIYPIGVDKTYVNTGDEGVEEDGVIETRAYTVKLEKRSRCLERYAYGKCAKSENYEVEVNDRYIIIYESDNSSKHILSDKYNDFPSFARDLNIFIPPMLRKLWLRIPLCAKREMTGSTIYLFMRFKWKEKRARKWVKWAGVVLMVVAVVILICTWGAAWQLAGALFSLGASLFGMATGNKFFSVLGAVVGIATGIGAAYSAVGSSALGVAGGVATAVGGTVSLVSMFKDWQNQKDLEREAERNNRERQSIKNELQEMFEKSLIGLDMKQFDCYVDNEEEIDEFFYIMYGEQLFNQFYVSLFEREYEIYKDKAYDRFQPKRGRTKKK